MGRKINNWKQLRDSKAIEKLARQHDVNLRQGRGSHIVLEKNGTAETFYPGEVSIGVARAIFKFFVKIGAIASFLLIVAAMVIGLL